MSRITLLHTAAVHAAAFDALAPEAGFTHVVRPDWLQRAQGGIDIALRREITEAIQAARGTVLCTCTTIGKAAEEAGAIRIDWPMMQEAARLGGPVLMAYCLDSTAEPSEALLHRAFGTRDPQLTCLQLGPRWPLFEAGDSGGFAQAIAADVLQALEGGTFGCVVLAQASMTGAAETIRAGTDVPVLASPELAAAYLLAQG
ncbi:hypothetical protein RA19_05230 [Leisingera sp. ANG-M1]|uniref:hypothetical protein n=1 Tax=Leisingera sp. ANG-M1 TaxID=1577895 RepID=UPI00057F5824|nr:hypothetical protein [Leisingera sp. ANG-M1]KIC12018.1 hypothetical protein RA19_05230 [Leisingera sp. ANG-M1]